MADTKVWTKEEIIALLTKDGNKDMVIRKAILELYRRQTVDERSSSTTKHSNGVGFSAFHAKTGSKFARLMLQGHTLYPGSMRKLEKIAVIHAGQLVEQANLREQEKALGIRRAG